MLHGTHSLVTDSNNMLRLVRHACTDMSKVHAAVCNSLQTRLSLGLMQVRCIESLTCTRCVQGHVQHLTATHFDSMNAVMIPHAALLQL